MPDLKQTAQTIIHTVIKAIDPYQAIMTQMACQDQTLHCAEAVYDLTKFKRVRVIGFGKASAPMAQAVSDILADRISDGVVIVKYGHNLPENLDISPVQILEAGHPVPDENSLAHGKTLLNFLSDSQESDLVICLISGGGSALLTQPIPEISLDHIQALTKALLRAGATINEINTIRKHISQVKGGHLARHIYPATTISLILSDVGGDPLDIIASGPTVPDPAQFSDAVAVIEKYDLSSKIPAEVLNYLKQGQAGQKAETPKPGDPIFERVSNYIIANNRLAVDAAKQAAKNLGFYTQISDEFIEGEARDVARKTVEKARQFAQEAASKPAALIQGGETTVTLKGNGLGGRNQEMALASAPLLESQPNMLLVYFATDGNDGPTDAAGGFVDSQTMVKARDRGLDPGLYLANNDSYHFLKAVDDLIMTGPTNTNVNDLIIVLVS